MTSFFATENYAPMLVLLAGLATLAGLWGTGSLFLQAIHLRLPSPWHDVTAMLLGIQVLSLVVQAFAMLEMATPRVLRALWWSLSAIGITMLVVRTHKSHKTAIGRLLPSGPSNLLPIFVVSSAILTNMLIALAPSSKIDELYYHMLVPSRIVSDGALRFYREPWEGAIWPQMTYQISAAPVHAIGYPDAFNVVSFGLSLTLLWFAWRTIQSSTQSPAWAALWVGALGVGLYPAVWHVTGGAHAMGDLAIASAIVALCDRERLLVEITPLAYAAMLSFLLLSAATSKVSLLPMCAVLLCFIAGQLIRSPTIRWQTALTILTPWLIFYCPIGFWTYAQSGSPFGPMLTSILGPSIYPAGWTQKSFDLARTASQLPPSLIAYYLIVNYSPLIWLGAFGAGLATSLPLHRRMLLIGLFALQCALIYWLLPYDARFLGGLHYGLAIAFACFATPQLRNRLSSAATAATALFIVPWIGLQIYYAKAFFPASLGGDKLVFYHRYVAFYWDYVALDHLLPKDAVLLVHDLRLGSVYAPRPVFFDPGDLPQGKQAVLFTLAEGTGSALPKILGYKTGEPVYQNDRAVVATYRTPGRRPDLGRLQVLRLEKEIR